jgi:hypothetical protein
MLFRILYERLSAVPPSPPGGHDTPSLPPVHSGPGVPPPHSIPQPQPSGRHREPNEPLSPLNPKDHAFLEYIRTHPNVRLVAGPDGRPVPIPETALGPGVAPPPHGSHLYTTRRGSNGHEGPRQLPPLPHVLPVQHYEQSRTPSHPHAQPRSHSSPHLQPGASHERSRSSHSVSRSRSHNAPPGYHQEHPHTPHYPPDHLPHIPQIAPGSSQGERDWSRRHDMHDMAGSHEPHHPRHPMPSPHPPHAASRNDSRGQGPTRSQHQQRVLLSDMEHEHEHDGDRDWNYERDVARERDMGFSSPRYQSPPPGHHARPASERSDYHDRVTSRAREEPGYYAGPSGGGYVMVSRSGSPGSGSGSASGYGPGDPATRSDGQYLERDRTWYASRARNHPTNEEIDFIHEDGRSRDRMGGGGAGFPPEPTRPSMDSRKRSRHELDVEDDVAYTSSGRDALPFSGGDHLPKRYPNNSSRGEEMDRGHD